MKDFLLTLLQSVIIAAVPVVTIYVCSFFSAIGKQAKERAEAESAKNLIDDAVDAVNTAVISTSQVYVEALKKSGNFNIENQKEAFRMSYNTAVSIMTDEVKEFIDNAYGSLDNWLWPQIEAAVKRNK